jgi:hypothetical protein
VASAGYAAVPFYIAGGLKIVYDLLIYRDFRAIRPPEERSPGPPGAAVTPGREPPGAA